MKRPLKLTAEFFKPTVWKPFGFLWRAVREEKVTLLKL